MRNNDYTWLAVLGSSGWQWMYIYMYVLKISSVKKTLHGSRVPLWRMVWFAGRRWSSPLEVDKPTDASETVKLSLLHHTETAWTSHVNFELSLHDKFPSTRLRWFVAVQLWRDPFGRVKSPSLPNDVPVGCLLLIASSINGHRCLQWVDAILCCPNGYWTGAGVLNTSATCVVQQALLSSS